jgi:hypothetical protein
MYFFNIASLRFILIRNIAAVMINDDCGHGKGIDCSQRLHPGGFEYGMVKRPNCTARNLQEAL